MELKNFITQALIDIAEGVNTAREKTTEAGVHIAQALYADRNQAVNTQNRGVPIPEFIEFDIAVTTSQDDGITGGIKVLALAFGKTESKNKNENITRIKFRVPVHWDKPDPQYGMKINPAILNQINHP